MAPNNTGQQFLFVNKSRSSAHLSKSQAVEKAAIQRHVQTGRQRCRKSKRPEVHHQQSASSQPLMLSRNPKHPSSRRPFAACSLPQADLIQPDGEQEDTRIQDSNCLEVSAEANYGLASLVSPSILVKQDPFDASSVFIDKRVAGLLHYYMYYYHPSQWPNEVALLRKGVYIFHGTVLNIIKTAIADKLAMYCLLTASASRLQFVDHLSCPLVANSENYYMRLALEHMTPYIGNADFAKPDQLAKSLTCIGLLGSAEAYRGNITGCKTHFGAQVKLVKMKGGLAHVKDKYLQGHLAMADLFLACVNLQPCLLDCSYDPGSAASLKLSNEELNSFSIIGRAAALLEASDDLVPTALKAVIAELLESHAVKTQIVHSKMSVARATQVMHWITLRNMSIRHRLLRLELTDSRSHILCMAVIMWSLFAMNITGRAKTVRVMAHNLMQSLSAANTSTWNEIQDVRLWIVLVGLYCATEASNEAFWLFKECFSSITVQTMSRSSSTIANLANQLELFQHDFFFDIEAQRTRNYMLAKMIASAIH